MPFAGDRAKSAAASRTVYRRFNVLPLLATPRVSPYRIPSLKDDTLSTEGLR